MNKYIETAQKYVLDTIKQENNRPVPAGIIIKKIKDSNPEVRKNDIYKAIDYLEEFRYIRKNHFGKYLLDYIEYSQDDSQYYECEITNINNSLNGFATYYNENNERVTFYIQYNDLKEAILKDRVLVAKLLKPTKDKEDELDYGRVLKIIERTKTSFSAVIDQKGNFSIDDPKFYPSPILDSEIKVHEPTRILVKLKKIQNKKGYFVYEKTIGSIDAKGTDIDAIILDSGFALDFPEEIKTVSQKIDFNFTDYDKSIRKDLRNKQVVSIDPEGSKDMDDAVCVEKLGNGNYLLTVCIADVSYYVHNKSDIDLDAYSKCTSVYLPDRVLPMLHHQLSNNICSLNESTDRFCLACEIEVNAKSGEIEKSNLTPAVINSKFKLSYDAVNDFYKGKETNWSDSLKQQLTYARELFKVIRANKTEKGYVELDIKEPTIICDDNGKPIDIVIKERKDAQKLIEDFMVICNEAVTKIAIQQKLPFIYRIHEKPDLTKIKKLKTELIKMQFKGVSSISDTELTQKDISYLVESNREHPLFDILNLMLLMSMSKASYATNNIGHFGLALQDYTHFTSPIRRYSDLIVHRIFWMFIFAKEKFSNEQRHQLESELEQICEECNNKEIAAVSLEREAMAYKMAEYMENYVGHIYNATISTVTSFGFFVALDNCVEGLVPISSLTNDYYVFDADTMVLSAKNSNQFFTLGQRVKVKLVSSDKKTRKIDFALA